MKALLDLDCFSIFFGMRVYFVLIKCFYLTDRAARHWEGKVSWSRADTCTTVTIMHILLSFTLPLIPDPIRPSLCVQPLIKREVSKIQVSLLLDEC